ncbi:MAG: UDP-N-acetylglucosamine pyrophosphorylase [Clostridiales bacterium]|nr:UDP-N-acetylglucosamine pyrophosphorylase [Clostridiales bacterium]
MTENLKVEYLFDKSQTIAHELFTSGTYSWEIIPKISEFILDLGPKLPEDEYDQVGDNVWIAKSAKVAESASIAGPTIIGKEAEIRQCAYIRGNAIVGEGAVVGNSTELKNVILFNKVQVPHYNYVGDSILGYKAHMGAGSITSNVKADKTLVTINCNGEKVETKLKKLGALIGDYGEIGCNAVLNPGSVIGRNSSVYPLTMVRGYIPENSICKRTDIIISKK